MIFACTQENLAQGLALVGHIPGKNANLPILSNVLLKTEGGNLKLSTTNLEMAVSALVRGRVDEQGEFTVPAKLFQDYISLLPTGKVEISVKGDTLEIKADGQTTSIQGMVATEFPLIPKLTKGQGYHLKAEALRRAVNQVVFAVSASESRPELAGVACFFHGQEKDSLVMAATDSYRLAECTLALNPGAAAVESHCIVPSRAMQEIARILAAYKDDLATPEDVEWAMSDSQLVITYGNVELISRLIEGTFPDYRQIIPTQFRSKVQVKRGELSKAIRAAALFARQGIYDIHLELSSTGMLKISSANTGTGAHTTEIKVESPQEENKVTLNFKYVSDGLSVMGSDAVYVQMIDAMNPVVLIPADESGFQYVVMPIRA